MKDEIKEILDKLKDDTYVPLEDNREYKLLDKGDDIILLDCITNLQEENERLEKVIISIHKELKSLYNHLTKKDLNYKSRNEKAIEKIIKIQENAIKYGAYHDASICQDLLNILNGGDE